MSDAKSKFKRPETPPTILGPDVDRFVSGPTPSPEPVRAEAAPAVRQLDQVEEKTTKPEQTKRLTIDIPESLHKRVKSQCATQGTTIADVVRAILERKFPEAKA
jgi:hypothetical protein